MCIYRDIEREAGEKDGFESVSRFHVLPGRRSRACLRQRGAPRRGSKTVGPSKDGWQLCMNSELVCALHMLCLQETEILRPWSVFGAFRIGVAAEVSCLAWPLSLFRLSVFCMRGSSLRRRAVGQSFVQHILGERLQLFSLAGSTQRVCSWRGSPSSCLWSTMASFFLCPGRVAWA